MPRRRVKGKKETISFRDFEVLEFICRFGVVNREAMSYWAQTGRSVTLDRERRLREADLIDAHPPIGRSGPPLAATLRGLGYCERRELGPAAVSVYSANHSIACARVAAQLERAGEVIFSERELAHEERWLGERTYSTEPKWPAPGFHRPDLVAQRLREDGRDIAIEVEISEKSPERLRQIVDSWGRKHGFDRWPGAVLYLCSQKTIRPVRRAIEKTYSDGLVEARLLDFDTDLLPRPESEPSGGLGDGRQPRRGSGRSPLTAAPPPLLSRPGRGGIRTQSENGSVGRTSGHVKLRKGKRGSVWYLRYRRADGSHGQQRLGPNWTGRGRRPAGHYTRRMADDALQ